MKEKPCGLLIGMPSQSVIPLVMTEAEVIHLLRLDESRSQPAARRSLQRMRQRKLLTAKKVGPKLRYIATDVLASLIALQSR